MERTSGTVTVTSKDSINTKLWEGLVELLL